MMNLVGGGGVELRRELLVQCFHDLSLDEVRHVGGDLPSDVPVLTGVQAVHVAQGVSERVRHFHQPPGLKPLQGVWRIIINVARLLGTGCVLEQPKSLPRESTPRLHPLKNWRSLVEIYTQE